MILYCEVEVVYRDGSNSTVSTKRRSMKSVLGIGKDKTVGNNSYAMLHFTILNKNGFKYKLNGNVDQVFTKFSHQGKSTVRFKAPEHDLCIKCDPDKLKEFLKLLQKLLCGKVNENKLMDVRNIVYCPKKYPPTRISVSDAKSLPGTELPAELRRLELRGLGLRSLERRVISLECLQYLDLSDNCIRKLPPSLGNMRSLLDLNLSKNELGSDDKQDWRWMAGEQIRSNLKLLNLSYNKLSGCLPPQVCQLRGLVTLRLNNNKLNSVPGSIKSLSFLKYLSIANNELTSLPATMLTMKFNEINISCNQFQSTLPQPPENNQMTFKMKTLVQLAGTVVLRSNLFYSKEIIPFTLVDLLDSANYCVCGQTTLDVINGRTKKVLMRKLKGSVLADCVMGPRFDVIAYICSMECFKIFDAFGQR